MWSQGRRTSWALLAVPEFEVMKLVFSDFCFCLGLCIAGNEIA